SAAGAVTISGDNIFLTSPDGTGPDLVGVSVRRVTATTATIGWNTDTGAVAQVEYGATANYGAFTLLRLFSGPGQEILLTGLLPATNYHFRVNAWDGVGNLGASGDFVFRTANAGAAT